MVALLLVACVPSERRLLVLDLALADRALVAPTLRPWAEEGYVVDYRPFYPHLVRADLDRYGTVILLGGRGPAPATDALGLADLALLSEGVPRGLVAVLAYAGDGEGALDRWTMNRWLRAVGAGVAIAEWPLEDTTVVAPVAPEPQPPAAPAGHALGIVAMGRFPASRNHPLTLRDPASALARSTSSAFTRAGRDSGLPQPEAAVVAASRVGRGLVIVTSRHFLAALGPDVRPATVSPLLTDSLASTHAFLRALARWTRRPAEWAHVPPASQPQRLTLAGARGPVSRRPPADAAPAGVARDTTGGGVSDSGAPAVPAWARRQGFRVAWARGPLARGDVFLATQAAALDSMLEFLDAAGFNALATPVTPGLLADTGRARGGIPRDYETAAWRRALDRLATTSVRWLPTLALDRLRRVGENPAPRCLLEDSVWTTGVRPALRSLALHGRERSGVVAGIVIDVTAPRDSMAAWTCDADVAAAVRGLGRDSTTLARVLALAPAARYDWLLASGLLGPFLDALERELARRVAALRDEARRLHPGLVFVVRAAAPPGDWRTLGLLRGLSTPEVPVVLWTTEPDPRALLGEWRTRGIAAVHVMDLTADRVPARAWPRLRNAAFVASHGFALGPVDRVLAAPRTAEGPVAADSLARLLRRLARER